MKLSKPSALVEDMHAEASAPSLPLQVGLSERSKGINSSYPAGFAEIYDGWFEQVARWVSALGGPSGDVDDLTQDTFLIIGRRLHDFDGQNLPGWLYRVAKSVVRDHRRRAWFKHILFGVGTVVEDVASEQTPATELEGHERQHLLFQILSKMTASKRETFILFEIVGHSGEEIAELLQIPINTVWTRLHHARKEFYAHVTELEAKEGER